MSAKKWEVVGSMRQGDDGTYYLKIDKDIPAGRSVQMAKPDAKFAKFVEKGIMSQDEADEKINKIPAYVRFDLVLPPPKDGSGTNF